MEVQKKSGLGDVKRADFIRNWRRSRLKNPDKLKISIKKNVRNLSCHKFLSGFDEDPDLPSFTVLSFVTPVHITQTATRVGPNYTLHSRN